MNPSGSIYYDKYEYYQSTGTMINVDAFAYISKSTENERLLICENCNTEYILNMNTKEYLLALKCTQCGGKLRFKR